jgi:hypothetical protein
MFRFTLAFTALSLMICCTPSAEKSVVDITEGEWVFSLANLVPERRKYDWFSPGDRLTVTADSLTHNDWYDNQPDVMPRLAEGTRPDTVTGFTAEAGFGSTLRVAHFKGDSLLREWIFERPRAVYDTLPYGALTGKSYFFKYPDSDTMRAYFGVAENIFRVRRKDTEVEYFNSTQPYSNSRRSVINKGRHYWSYPIEYTPTGLRHRKLFYFLNSGTQGFDRYRLAMRRKRDGTPVGVWYDQQGGKYQKGELELTLAPSIAPPGMGEQAFAEFVNTGIIKIDDTYPRVDSADVSYNYQDRYYSQEGLEYSELTELEITFQPGGDFVLFVRGRPVKISKWRLTPDGSFVELLGEKGEPTDAYPIVVWTDEYIDLRMPLKVKTREPRGVELESYCVIDAYVHIKKAAAATSSR